MDTVNKQKNKNSCRGLNDWLDMLLCWKWTPIQNKFDIQTNDNLKEIVDEYRVLITIADPSPAQQIRIEKILELAVYDTVLSKLIDRVDQDIAREIGLFEENTSNSHNSTAQPITSKFEDNNYLQNVDDKIVKFPLVSVSRPIQKTYLCRPHFNIGAAISGGAVALLGVYIFNPCSLLGTNSGKGIDSGASSNSKSNQLPIKMGASTTVLHIATHGDFQKGDLDNKEYIISLQEVGKSKKEQIGEEEQICFETQQVQAKQKQHISETRQSLGELIIWKYEKYKSQEKVLLFLQIAPNLDKVANNFSSLQNVSFSIGKTACP